jgi:flagellum-specific peptidoglycan hydrolase FlgJ
MLDTHLRGIESAIKNYSAGYAHDGTYLTKIAEIIKSIGAESPIRIKRSV